MRPGHSFLIALFIFLIPQSGAASDSGNISAAISTQAFDASDRLAILNLVQAYSHAADGLHTELFGSLFTADAVFRIAAYGAAASTPAQTLGRGRIAIVAALAGRHQLFRESGVQRRHFLTNPIVWNQNKTKAEVSVYLQLRSSTIGGASEIIATGRYKGRVRKTAMGWRISEWTLFPDQAVE